MAKNRTSGMFLKAGNAVVSFLVVRAGVNLAGAEVLEVPGRATGAPHRVPVNPIEVAGTRYLFSPRGETSWVRNIRASGGGSLHKRRRSTGIRVQELTMPDEKLPVIRAYLAKWGWQVGQYVDVPKNPGDDDILAIADRHPVFRIVGGA